MTIAAVAVAVVVLAFVLWQVISVGGARSSAAPAVTPTAGTVGGAGGAETGAAAAGASEPASADSTPAASEPTPAPSKITADIRVLQPNYTVQEGDTLGKIAERSGNSVDTLQGLNKLPDRGKLSIGQKLIVPES